MSSAKTFFTPVLMAAAALAASCATAPPQAPLPPGEASARAERAAGDQILANAVYSQLNADPVYYYRHVDVRVENGTAHLSGYVWSTDALYRARRIAQSVPGITSVATNQLELERNGLNNGVTR
ncbi:MAG TPA: BON domain-containing protein [Steroidobacteraceae bacterium]|nr:BON domain-containing protein [Steroidobacteraceae bacterium]